MFCPAQFVLTGSDPEGDSPSDVAFTPDGSTIVVAHRESGNLILWDAATRAFEGSVSVLGAGPVCRDHARRVEGGRRVPRNGRRVDRRSEHAGRDRGDPRRRGAGLGLDQR
jgi:WD40 repeat protein